MNTKTRSYIIYYYYYYYYYYYEAFDVEDATLVKRSSE